MKSDRVNDQTTEANMYRFTKYKYSYIYYSHPIDFYNTKQEKYDLEFLKTIGTVLNPSEINKNKMSVFINFTLYAKEVWFRGYTAGVCLEVIVAVLKHIPVYSLETKLPVSADQVRHIFNSYEKSGMFDHDFDLMYILFGKQFAQRFADIMDGDYP